VRPMVGSGRAADLGRPSAPPRPSGGLVDPSKFNMVEMKKPAFCQFKEIGDHVEGMLCTIENVEFPPTNGIGKRTGKKFTVMNTDTHERCEFYGSAQLNKDLRFGLLGHYLQVTFSAVEQLAGRLDENGMKVFLVAVSDRRVSQLYGVQWDAFVDYGAESAQS
jgi:hypothetical protein